ncbi:MAG: exoprotein, partial [Sphingomonadales bacterium]
MSEANLEDEPGVVLVESPGGRPRWKRKRVLAPAAVVTFLVLALGAAWLSRERIAGNIIEGQLAAYDIPATYTIERISGQTQVVRDILVGDPARPDLTVERAEVRIVYRLGTPRIGRITLINPRLYGRLANGRVSFGSLDKAIYRETGKPPGLPEIDLAIRDGRALIRTPYGPVGAKVDGAGLVSNGFAGTVAIAAPTLALSDCSVRRASAFGSIITSAGKPKFAGPLRLTELACPDRQIALSDANADVDLTADAQLRGLEGRVSLATGPVRYASYRANGGDLTMRGNWKNGLLDERHTIAIRGVTTPQASAALLTLEGSMRASEGFGRVDLRSDIEGNGLRPGPALQGALAQLARAGEGTLVEPLAKRFAGALTREARGSAVSGDLVVRRNQGVTSIIVPQAEMTGGGGARVLSVSRVEARVGGEALPRLAGNIATGGPDMPRINGRMERTTGGGTVFRLAMDRYSAGSSV